jgi:hypothetical protein
VLLRTSRCDSVRFGTVRAATRNNTRERLYFIFFFFWGGDQIFIGISTCVPIADESDIAVGTSSAIPGTTKYRGREEKANFAEEMQNRCE